MGIVACVASELCEQCEGSTCTCCDSVKLQVVGICMCGSLRVSYVKI